MPGEPFPVPQSLRELVRDRLEHLQPAARETAEVVAALPQPTVDRVEAALGQAGDADGLGQALAAGIVEIAGDRVRFTHPLLGSIVYSEASPARRRELHARLAALAGDIEERARHLALAATAPDRECAAILDEAARRALLRGAPEAAAELLDRARRLTPPADEEDSWRRGFDAADAHLRAGDSQAARSLLVDLVAVSRDGPSRARALLRLAGALILEDEWRSIGDLCAEARSQSDELEIKANCEQLLAWMEWFGGDLRAAVPRIRAAVSLAEQTGDPEALAQLLGEQAYLEGMLGERRTDSILGGGGSVRRRDAAGGSAHGSGPDPSDRLLEAGVRARADG